MTPYSGNPAGIAPRQATTISEPQDAIDAVAVASLQASVRVLADQVQYLMQQAAIRSGVANDAPGSSSGLEAKGGVSTLTGIGKAGMKGTGGAALDTYGPQNGGEGLVGQGGVGAEGGAGGIGASANGGTGGAPLAGLGHNGGIGGPGAVHVGGNGTAATVGGVDGPGGTGVDATGGNGAGTTAAGGAGIRATGGASAGAALGGYGVDAVGGAGNGNGVRGTGVGVGAGVVGQGGGSGSGGGGVAGSGGGTQGYGVQGTGSGSGNGVVGSGGTTGAGGRFSGNANRGAITLVPLAAAPGAPAEGDVYYNSVTKKSYTYDGTTWQPHF